MSEELRALLQRVADGERSDEAHTALRDDARAMLSFVSSAAGQREGWTQKHPTDEQVREAMQDAWDSFCDDAQAIPGDIYREGRKTFFRAGTWADHTAMNLRAMLAASPSAPEERRDEVQTFLADLSSGKLVREVMAAGAIIDVMTGGKFDWRSRINDSDFTSSADWMTALAYARAAIAAPEERRDEVEDIGLLEAARDLLALHDQDQRTVGYRKDRWDCLRANVERLS